MWCLFVQVFGDAAGVSAGLHRPGQTSAGPERALRQSADRLWKEMGEWDVSRLARKSSSSYAMKVKGFGCTSHLTCSFMFSLLERDEQRFDTCRSSSGPLCFFFLGGKTLSAHIRRFIIKNNASGCSFIPRRILLFSYSFPQELASLGLDRLKSALMALGLKCGGWECRLRCWKNNIEDNYPKRLKKLEPDSNL